MAKRSYDKAFQELEQIIEELQNESVSIDQLSKKVAKASELIKYCKGRLREVESDLSEEE